MRLVILLLVVCCIPAEDSVPIWVLEGVLQVETRSTYQGDTIVYVDQRIGSSGERGPYQCTEIAFRQVSQPGERFVSLSADTAFAEQIAIRYLLYLYNGPAHGSWPHAIQQYHRGPGNYAYSYYVTVRRLARKAGYEVPSL